MQQQKTPERRAYLSEAETPSTWARAKMIIGLVALAGLILFLLQNFQNVEVNVLWMTWHPHLVWGLLGAAIAGAIATIVLGTLQRRARARTRASKE